MDKKTIIVKTSSSNLWWGIYGLCGKTGWEDLTLFDEKGEKIAWVCLCTKGYMRASIDNSDDEEIEKAYNEAVEKYLADNKSEEDSDDYKALYNTYYNDSETDNLQESEMEKAYKEVVEKYLADDKCHYRFYYDNKDDSDFYEVPYNAPKNNKGVKPSSVEIWHPDEGIGIKTIETGILDFAKRYLGLEDCSIKIEESESLEESIEALKDYKLTFNGENPVKIEFSEDVIEELSILWKTSKIEVLAKLKKAVY